MRFRLRWKRPLAPRNRSSASVDKEPSRLCARFDRPRGSMCASQGIVRFHLCMSIRCLRSRRACVRFPLPRPRPLPSTRAARFQPIHVPRVCVQVHMHRTKDTTRTIVGQAVHGVVVKRTSEPRARACGHVVELRAALGASEGPRRRVG